MSKRSRQEFMDPPAGYPGATIPRVDDGDGAPDVPEVEVEDPHWKVGDGMTNAKGKPDFLIGQIAVVRTDVGQTPKPEYDVVFFDTKGKERGRLHFVQK